MTKPLNKWRCVRTLVPVAVVSLLLAVTNTRGERSEIKTNEAHRINESVLRIFGNANRPNAGDLTFSYGRRKSFKGAAADRTVLISQQAVYSIVDELKKQIALPFKIQVIFKDCGGPDSYYDEDSHEIVICHELIAAYSDLFSRTLTATTAQDEAAKNTVVSVFLHEVGHALIDGWNLSITGREEDAADQFSTLMLLNDMPNGEQVALAGARSYKLLADLENGEEKDYSDPHSMDEQRYFDTICLVYGHKPKQHEYLIKNGTLSAERAYGCEKTFARVNKSWQTLLAPHFIRTQAP